MTHHGISFPPGAVLSKPLFYTPKLKTASETMMMADQHRQPNAMGFMPLAKRLLRFVLSPMAAMAMIIPNFPV